VRILETLPSTETSTVDPLTHVRTFLQLVGAALAKKDGSRSTDWSVYCEKHMRNVGVRFMLRRPDGTEVDLQKIPGTLEAIVAWQP